jgi:hypothetical protein
MNCLRKLSFAVLGVVLMGSLATAQDARKQNSDRQQPAFGGEYSALNPDQKRLVDDWFRRLGKVLGKPISPEEGYDNVRLSVRTTFDAVTHALLRTPLTDKSGATLEKSALGLISKVNDVAGSEPGTRGDKQFRIYVELVPGAFELLGKSREFARARDNKVYHKGYPVCYRSQGGAPSIQISATEKGTLADIDVDYRSATFPAFLINGHLTASNSDVRAGDNDQRHNKRWSGLQNWWRTLLGLRILDQPSAEAEAEGIIDRTERTKPNAKPADAVHDFLTSWLVEQKPDESLAYFSDSAFPCMELEQGRPIDRGMARFTMLKGLQEVNRRIGNVTDLLEVTTGVRLVGPRIKVIKQPYHAQFVLYDVREDLAELFKCENKLNPERESPKAARSHKFGKYVGAVFRLKAGSESGETVATLWEKKKKYWKLISYDVEPEFEAIRSMAAAPQAKAPTLAYVEGDKDLIRAARSFYEDWFVRRRVEVAFQYVSPLCYPCVNLYRSEETPEPKTPEEEAKLIKVGMERIAEAAGSARKLTDAIVAPAPSHPDIKLVRQRDSKAFVIASIPDYMAAAANCASRTPGGDLAFTVPSEGVKYGSYFATGFKMANEVEDSGVLWIVWSKQAGQWKIVSYALLTP